MNGKTLRLERGGREWTSQALARTPGVNPSASAQALSPSAPGPAGLKLIQVIGNSLGQESRSLTRPSRVPWHNRPTVQS